MLRKANRIRTIHSSLAIEHNSLTLQQVTDIVNGKRVLGAPDEILEVKTPSMLIVFCSNSMRLAKKTYSKPIRL